MCSNKSFKKYVSLIFSIFLCVSVALITACGVDPDDAGLTQDERDTKLFNLLTKESAFLKLVVQDLKTELKDDPSNTVLYNMELASNVAIQEDNPYKADALMTTYMLLAEKSFFGFNWEYDQKKLDSRFTAALENVLSQDKYKYKDTTAEYEFKEFLWMTFQPSYIESSTDKGKDITLYAYLPNIMIYDNFKLYNPLISVNVLRMVSTYIDGLNGDWIKSLLVKYMHSVGDLEDFKRTLPKGLYYEDFMEKAGFAAVFLFNRISLLGYNTEAEAILSEIEMTKNTMANRAQKMGTTFIFNTEHIKETRPISFRVGSVINSLCNKLISSDVPKGFSETETANFNKLKAKATSLKAEWGNILGTNAMIDMQYEDIIKPMMMNALTIIIFAAFENVVAAITEYRVGIARATLIKRNMVTPNTTATQELAVRKFADPESITTTQKIINEATINSEKIIGESTAKPNKIISEIRTPEDILKDINKGGGTTDDIMGGSGETTKTPPVKGGGGGSGGTILTDEAKAGVTTKNSNLPTSKLVNGEYYQTLDGGLTWRKIGGGIEIYTLNPLTGGMELASTSTPNPYTITGNLDNSGNESSSNTSNTSTVTDQDLVTKFKLTDANALDVLKIMQEQNTLEALSKMSAEDFDIEYTAAKHSLPTDKKATISKDDEVFFVGLSGAYLKGTVTAVADKEVTVKYASGSSNDYKTESLSLDKVVKANISTAKDISVGSEILMELPKPVGSYLKGYVREIDQGQALIRVHGKDMWDALDKVYLVSGEATGSDKTEIYKKMLDESLPEKYFSSATGKQEMISELMTKIKKGENLSIMLQDIDKTKAKGDMDNLLHIVSTDLKYPTGHKRFDKYSVEVQNVLLSCALTGHSSSTPTTSYNIIIRLLDQMPEEDLVSFSSLVKEHIKNNNNVKNEDFIESLVIAEQKAKTKEISPITFKYIQTELLQKNLEAQLAYNIFTVSRGFNNYTIGMGQFKSDFVKKLFKLNTDSHWIDSGAGNAVAASQYLDYDVKGVEKPNVTAITYKVDEGQKDLINKNINLLTGELFENMSLSKITERFGKGDCLTDIYGVLTYTDSPDVVLNRYTNKDLMKKDGLVFIVSDFLGDVVQTGQKTTLLPQWIKANIPGAKLDVREIETVDLLGIASKVTLYSIMIDLNKIPETFKGVPKLKKTNQITTYSDKSGRTFEVVAEDKK